MHVYIDPNDYCTLFMPKPNLRAVAQEVNNEAENTSEQM